MDSPIAGILPDYSNLRGLNYVPSWAHNAVHQWLDYDAARVEQDLDVLGAFGVNGIRTFGHYEVWLADRAAYAQRVGHLVGAAARHGMTTLLVLFDSVGIEPSGSLRADADRAGSWVKGPASARLQDPAFEGAARAYLDETVAAIDAALEQASGPVPATPVILDAWNEPSGAAAAPPYPYLGAVVGHLHSIGSHPVTVGFAFAEANGPVLAALGDVLDVLSFHPYGVLQALVEHEVATARELAAAHGGPPVIATEAGYPGYFQSYFHVIEWLRAAGCGFFLWEAFAGHSPFVAGGGIFYTQKVAGEQVFVRDLEGADALLALAVEEGFVPGRLAVLRPDDAPGFVPYGTVPYGFTTPDAHRLLLDWKAAYGVAHPPLGPGASQLGFYRTLVAWSAVTLQRLELASPSLEAAVHQLGQLVATGVAGSIEDQLAVVAAELSTPIAAGDLAEPASRPPRIVTVGLEVEETGDPGRVDVRARVLVLAPDTYLELLGVFLLLYGPDEVYRANLPLDWIDGSGAYEYAVTTDKELLRGTKLLALAVDQAGTFAATWQDVDPALTAAGAGVVS